jgi:hypothetical protein
MLTNKLVACVAHFLTLVMEVVHSFEMQVNLYWSTWHYVQEGSTQFLSHLWKRNTANRCGHFS